MRDIIQKDLDIVYLFLAGFGFIRDRGGWTAVSTCFSGIVAADTHGRFAPLKPQWVGF